MDTVTISTEEMDPMVFTCGACRTIISDSTQYICGIEQLGLVAVRGVSGVELEPQTQEFDLLSLGDSECSSLRCQRCQSEVGRVYKRVPESLQAIRCAFSLNVTSIDSYQLSACEMQMDHSPGAPVIPQAGASEPAACQELRERLECLEADLLKVQNIVLLHNERLEAVEMGALPTLPAPIRAPTPLAPAPGSNAPFGSGPIVEPNAMEGQQSHQDAMQPATTGAALVNTADAEAADQGSGPSAPGRVAQRCHLSEAAGTKADANGAMQQPVDAARSCKPRQKRSAATAHRPEGGKKHAR